MTQINLSEIKNPVHKALMMDYGKRMSSTPLKTRFHEISYLDSEQDALNPDYDLSSLFIDELIYRLYTKNAISLLVYGDRRDYKSTLVLQFWLWWYEILKSSHFFPPLVPDFNNIVDNDITLLDRYMKAPKFSPFIKDEFDTNTSGLGNMTTSQTLINVIKRSAYHQKPIFICSPVWKFYPVDYYLQTWEYCRYGKKEVLCIVYDKNANPKGHARFPMPSDEMIERYDKRKQEFMGNMEKLRFTVEEELDGIAESLVNFPEFPEFNLTKKVDRVGFKSWAFKKFPVLQSKVMQDNILDKVIFMQNHKLTRML